MKKLIAKLLILVLSICGALCVFTACTDHPSGVTPPGSTQPSDETDIGNENNGNENDDGTNDDGNKDENGAVGIWTPPVKQD